MQFEDRNYELSDGRTITINSGFIDGFGEIIDKNTGNGFFMVSITNSKNKLSRNFIIVFDKDGEIVEPAFDLLNPEDNSVFVEGFFPDGSIISSNKYYEDGKPRTYSHHKIEQTEDGYTLVAGRTWEDGMWRLFNMTSDGQIEITKCNDRSKTSYDCTTFVETSPKQKTPQNG